MLVVITLPEPSTVLTNISTWSSPLFNEFIMFAYVSIGITIGFLAIIFVINVVKGAFFGLVNKVRGSRE